MKKFLRNMHSYPVAASVLAILVAASGTAWAAVTVTGKNVRDSTITTADIKNGSLTSTIVSSSSKAVLKKKGVTGDTGDKGSTGASGNTGSTGPTGTAAKNAYAWAYHTEDSLLVDPSSNNSPAEDWFPDNGGTGDWTVVGANWASVKVELASDKNDGLLVLEGESDVVATAHVTGWHADANVHSRLECRLRITDTSTNSSTTLGQPVIITTEEAYHVNTVALVGGIRKPAGTYGLKAECRDLDWHSAGYGAWYVAKGNISTLSARNWR